MEESKFMTSSDQVLIDNQLTEEGNSDSFRSLPFHLSIQNEVRSLGKGESETDYDNFIEAENDLLSSGLNNRQFNIPPYYISRSVEYLKNYSNNLQSWTGHVIEIKKASFVAELEDTTNKGTKELAEIEISAVSPDDCPLVELGAVFYWTIGAKMNRGQISKESIIRFQRIQDWNENDYDNVTDRASKLFENLKFE